MAFIAPPMEVLFFIHACARILKKLMLGHMKAINTYVML